MGFLGPLIVWLIKRDDDAFVEDQAREALNFQLSLLVFLIGAIALMIAGIVTHASIIVISAILLFAIGIYSFIFSIVGGVQSAQGRLYRYPVTVRFIGPRNDPVA